MRAFQKLVNEKVEAEPSVAQFFTNVGSGSRSASSQGIVFCVFKPREQRDPIEQCLLRMQKSINTIPGITAVITPSPVLQINVGATNQTQGQYAYTISGIVPDDVYKAADQMMEKLRKFKGFSSLRSDLLSQHAESYHKHRSRTRCDLWRFHFSDPKFVEERLFPKLRLFDQTTGRSVSGDPRSERQRAGHSGRSQQSLRSQ